ncbi:MAG: hypothetical protein KJ638_10515 [Chloroflexi bacterium]|nr:hypothetical protein [Chloroflexota bacterium]
MEDRRPKTADGRRQTADRRPLKSGNWGLFHIAVRVSVVAFPQGSGRQSAVCGRQSVVGSQRSVVGCQLSTVPP